MTVQHEETAQIDALAEAVWRVMTDVERWPEWTESMRRIERLEDGPLVLGSRAQIEIKGAPKSVWTVTEYTEGRSFTWETSAMGVSSTARHVVEPADGGSRVTLSVQMGGLMATLLSPLVRSVAQRNVRMEAEGLRRRCESGG